MNPFKKEKGKLLWQDDRHILELQGCGRDAIRIRATMNGEFKDVPGALLEEVQSKAKVEIVGEEAVIENGLIEARVHVFVR